MKIGMMGGWNTDSGASFHAEQLGRAWVAQGHKLTVFTFHKYAFHGTQIVGEDEDYVIRCFTVEGYNPAQLDAVPFLTNDYEVFVVQDLGMLPKDLLGKIFHRIKNKAITVNVIHDGKLTSNPSFYQFDWTAIVCFDERYRNFLTQVYEPAKVHIIPYPCEPLRKGDKKEARNKLGLPQDKKIIYGFGPASEHIVELIDPMVELSKEYPILLLITVKKDSVIKRFEALKIERLKDLNIEVRQQSPTLSELYDYLHSADVLIFNKPSAGHVVVSSTAFQCMGAGCPIVARESDYVEFFNKEVMKYSNIAEFKARIRSVFDEDVEFTSTQKAAEEYVTKNSAQEIGKRYIKLFDSLLGAKI